MLDAAKVFFFFFLLAACPNTASTATHFNRFTEVALVQPRLVIRKNRRRIIFETPHYDQSQADNWQQYGKAARRRVCRGCAAAACTHHMRIHRIEILRMQYLFPKLSACKNAASHCGASIPKNGQGRTILAGDVGYSGQQAGGSARGVTSDRVFEDTPSMRDYCKDSEGVSYTKPFRERKKTVAFSSAAF